jgi:anthranilate phosphoribosyltransferase
MNVPAAILVGGKTGDLATGIDLTRHSINSGHGYEKLKGLVEFTNGDESKLKRVESQNA